MQEGESLQGYINRFRIANGHEIPIALNNALRVMYRGPKRTVSRAFDIVQTMLGGSVTLSKSWWLGRPMLQGYLGSHPPAVPNLVFGISFCPACLQDSGFHYALWELPLMEACPLHQCALLTACPACFSAFRWKDILPNWCCECDISLSALPLTPPKPGALNIALILVASEDVVLPKHMLSLSRLGNNSPHRLVDIYSGLNWATELRKFFLLCGSISRGVNPPRLRKDQNRALGGLWEQRLITDPIEKLIFRLLRVLDRRFHEKPLLQFVYPSDGLILVQDFVRKSHPGVVQTKIQKTLEQFLAAYAINLHLSLFTWFSQGKNSKSFKAYMSEFAAWWALLSSSFGDLDSAKQTVDLTMTHHLSVKRTRANEIVVVNILNLLLDASRQRFDVENYRELINRWRIPSVLREIRDPEIVFQRIGQHLASASNDEFAWMQLYLIREALKDLIREALKGKRP